MSTKVRGKINDLFLYFAIIIYSSLLFILPRLIQDNKLVYDTLIAEDGLFVNCYNSNTFQYCMREGYRGWPHTPSMFIAFFVHKFSIEQWALVNSVTHVVLLSAFSLLTYLFINQLFTPKKVALLVTLIIYSNPLIQIETIHQNASLYSYLIVPTMISIYKINSKFYNFILALFLVPISITWQFDSFFLVLITLIITYFRRGLSKRLISVIFTFFISLLFILTTNHLSDATGRIVNLRYSMVTGSLNSILTILPMLGLGTEWPYMSTDGQTFNPKFIIVVSQILYILILVFILFSNRKKIKYLFSKLESEAKDFLFLAIVYQIIVVFFLQSAARNIVIFQMILFIFIFSAFKNVLENKSKYLIFIVVAYFTLSMSQVNKLQFFLPWSQQIAVHKSECTNLDKNSNFYLFLPSKSTAQIEIDCNKLMASFRK